MPKLPLSSASEVNCRLAQDQCNDVGSGFVFGVEFNTQIVVPETIYGHKDTETFAETWLRCQRVFEGCVLVLDFADSFALSSTSCRHGLRFTVFSQALPVKSRFPHAGRGTIIRRTLHKFKYIFQTLSSVSRSLSKSLTCLAFLIEKAFRQNF